MSDSAGTLATFIEQPPPNEDRAGGATLDVPQPAKSNIGAACVLGIGAVLVATLASDLAHPENDCAGSPATQEAPQLSRTDTLARVKSLLNKDPASGMRALNQALSIGQISADEGAGLVALLLRSKDPGIAQAAASASTSRLSALKVVQNSIGLYRRYGGAEMLARVAALVEQSSIGVDEAFRYLAFSDAPEAEAFMGVLSEHPKLSTAQKWSLLAGFARSKHKYVRLTTVRVLSDLKDGQAKTLLAALRDDKDPDVAEEVEIAIGEKLT